MADSTAFVHVETDFTLQSNGLKETEKGIDNVNSGLEKMQKTYDRVKEHNRDLVSADIAPLFERVNDNAQNYADALNSSLASWSTMSSLGATMSKSIDDMYSEIASGNMNMYQSMGVDELLKHLKKATDTAAKFREAVGVGVVAHTAYIKANLSDLDKEEDLVRQGIAEINTSLNLMNTTATAAQVAEFTEWQRKAQDLHAEIFKLSDARAALLTRVDNGDFLDTEYQEAALQKLHEYDTQIASLEDDLAPVEKQMSDFMASLGEHMSIDEWKKLRDELRQTYDEERRASDMADYFTEKLARAGNGTLSATDNQIATWKEGLKESTAEAERLEAKAHAISEQMTRGGGEYWFDEENVAKAERLVGALDSANTTLNSISSKRQRILSSGNADQTLAFQRNYANYNLQEMKIEQINDRLKELGYTAEEAGTKGASSFSKFGNALSKALQSGASAFVSKTHKEFSGISKLVSKIAGGIRDWRKDQKSLADHAKTFYNTFNSLWRMLKTRAKRRLVGIIFEDLTTTVGEIARIEPRFNKAISGFIVSAKTLGAQIIASLEPLASIVLPILSQFLDYLTRGAAELAQFISRATGDTKFIEATKGQFDYAASLDKTTSSTKKATKAAKEYKNTVMSFDQLHKLNGDDESALDDALGLDGVNLDHANDKVDAINELGDRLWNALNAHDYEGAGRVIGDAINMGFGWLRDNFGWEENATKFTRWAENTGNLINGIIEGIDGVANGVAVGDVANSLINFIDLLTNPSSETSIHFEEAGKKLGETFAAALSTIDWEKAGGAFVNSLQGFAKMLTGFFTSSVTVAIEKESGIEHVLKDGLPVDALTGEILGDPSDYNLETRTWAQALGVGLRTMFASAVDTFDAGVWSDLFSSLINGFFQFLTEAFGDPAKAAEFGHKIADTINQTIKKLNAKDISSGINSFTASFTELFETLFKDIDFASAFNKLQEIAGGLNWGTLGETIGLFLAPAFLRGLGAGLGSLLKTGGKTLLAKLLTGGGEVASAISESSFATTLTAVLAEFGFSAAGFAALFAAAAIVVATNWGSIKDTVASLSEVGKSLIEDAVGLLTGNPPEQSTTEKMAEQAHQIVNGEPSTPFFQNNGGARGIESWVRGLRERIEYAVNQYSEMSEETRKAYEAIYGSGNANRTTDAARNAVTGGGRGSFLSESLMAKIDNTSLSDALPDWFKNRADTALGDADTATFTESLMTQAKESLALPTDSVATQPYETVKASLFEDIRSIAAEAAETVAGEIASKDFSVYLDSRVLATSNNSWNARTNKRQNPFYSGAY